MANPPFHAVTQNPSTSHANKAISGLLRDAVGCDARVNNPAPPDSALLFIKSYSANNGCVELMTPYCLSNNTKCYAPVRNHSSPTTSSPVCKRQSNILLSLPRHLSVLAAASNITLPPPLLNRIPLYPNLIIENLFPHQDIVPPNPPKLKGGSAMIGLVPRSEFMKWPTPKHAQKKTTFTADDIQKYIRNHRTMIGYHFNRNFGSKVEEFKSGPVTRYSVEDHDDWIIDRDATDIRVTNTHILDQYPLEQIMIC